jgi:holo-[acyl-carrier protein] synthase
MTGPGTYSVGVDLVSIGRIQRIIGRWGGRFLDRVFTAGEIAYCKGRNSPAESFAARFAAKEAFVKAVSRGHPGGIRYKDIEVVVGADGAPAITAHADAKAALGGGFAAVSLSHAEDFAVAVVITCLEVGR